MKLLTSLAIVSCLVSATPGCAQEDSKKPQVSTASAVADSNTEIGWTSEVTQGILMIGNPAPKLELTETVHGKKVEQLAKGKVTVVEFWATWCGPCLRGMPVISKLADKYRDEVVFVGVTDETEAKVEDFLTTRQSPGKTWSEAITYSLALDDSKQTNKRYMRASRQKGIPAAFIVGRDGILDWIGHPMEMAEPLQQIVDGTYDRKAAFKEQESMLVGVEAANRIEAAMRKEDIEGALAITDELAKKYPDDFRWPMVKMQILASVGESEKLGQLQKKLSKDAWDDADSLELIAWTIVADGLGEDFELALNNAKRASELTDDKDPSKLETLARVYQKSGKLEEAINWQKKAVQAAKDEGDQRTANYMARVLKEFQNALKKKEKE